MSTRQSVEDVNLSTCQHVIKFQISRSVKCHEVINFLSSFQELLVFFAIFCQLLPFFLHLFGTFHNCWQFLPPSSNFWQILPSFVFSLEFFFIFANFDIVWLLLVSFGNFLQFFLQLLPGFDSFEQFFAMFWQPLTILGKFWKIWQLLPLMAPYHHVIKSSYHLVVFFISSYFRPVNLSACLFVSL